MRRHVSLKSKLCTEGAGVNVAGMSAEVNVHYSGRSATLSQRLLASRGVKKTSQKSAEDIVGWVDSSEGLNIITPIGADHG